jgi:hypothetical protein
VTVRRFEEWLLRRKAAKDSKKGKAGTPVTA